LTSPLFASCLLRFRLTCVSCLGCVAAGCLHVVFCGKRAIADWCSNWCSFRLVQVLTGAVSDWCSYGLVQWATGAVSDWCSD
jgi:hypothetical protein